MEWGGSSIDKCIGNTFSLGGSFVIKQIQYKMYAIVIRFCVQEDQLSSGKRIGNFYDTTRHTCTLSNTKVLCQHVDIFNLRGGGG